MWRVMVVVVVVKTLVKKNVKYSMLENKQD